MLQEILLSLAGVPSPIWQKLDIQKEDTNMEEYVSLPEQAMLANLHHISQLHIELNEHCTAISSKHPSLVCRAVSSSIVHTHLAAFRGTVVDVERSIVTRDSSHVGGYQIIPLSTLVADFSPWTRRLEWLHKVTSKMRGGKLKSVPPSCTSSIMIDYLELERHTGYMDIGKIATELLVVAQSTWMRQVTSWILYGQLYTVDGEDFMIKRQSQEEEGLDGQYVLDTGSLPEFVSEQAAESILAIGNALRHAQSPAAPAQPQLSRGLAVSLITSHLGSVKLLRFPLNWSLFESTMVAINESVSRHALSSLLPKAQVFKVCSTLRDYMLLGRGEFAVTLIQNSDERILARTQSSSASRPVRKLGRVDDMIFKNSELGGILSKTWSDLFAMQGDSEAEDLALESAKSLMRFNCVEPAKENELKLSLSSVLPVPTYLSIELAPNSPLKMLLTNLCLQQYSQASSYLLSIRKSQLRVSSLWKMTSHRRCHPTPLAPPLSATEFGRRACRQRRARENTRASRLRRFWSTMNQSLFLLNEFNAYLHGECIRNSWDQFHRWLLGQSRVEQASEQVSKDSSLLESLHADTEQEQEAQKEPESKLNGGSSNDDPRTIARAHSMYLTALVSALLLNEPAFIKQLKSFLEMLDHMVALFARLATVWEGLDLQEDEGVMDAFSNLVQDEKEIMTEMDRARDELDNLLRQVVDAIRDVDKDQSNGAVEEDIASMGLSQSAKGDFVPWRARTLDRLIMKLDFLYAKEERGGDLVEELDYD